MPKISELTGAAALTGTELIAGVQSGSSVQITTQDIADLGGGGGDVVDDTTPQLGGDLDVNGNNITSSNGKVDLTGSTIEFSGENGTTTGTTVLLHGGDGTAIGGSIIFDVGRDTTDSSNDGTIQIRKPFGATSVEVRLFEGALNGTHYLALKAPDSVFSNRLWTIPQHQQSSGQMLGIDLGEYTVATLPPANLNANCRALATNASGGRTMVRSDGTNWKVIAVEGATVST